MKNSFIWGLAFAFCAVVFIARNVDFAPGPAPAPTPAPTPAPIGGEQFRAAFGRTSDRAAAKRHARDLADIAEAMKEILAYDWGRGGPSDLKQAHQVAKVRQLTRDKAMQGWSFLALYPELAPTLDTWFEQRVGREPGTLSAQDRERWLAAFADLYVALIWASDQL